MNIAGIAIIVVIGLFGIAGMHSGLVRKFSGVLALVISALLVGVILPYTTQVLREKTPVYEFLAEQGERLVSTKMVERAILDAAGSEQADSSGVSAGLAQQLIDSGMLPEGTQISDIGQISTDALNGLNVSALTVLDSLSKVEQTRLIKALPVPAFVQRMMVNFNNSDGYKKLQAEGFAQYLINFVVGLLVNIIAFFVTMLIIWLIVRGILSVLDIVARLPFLYSINRLGGLLVGLVEGVFFVWFVFLILSMFSGTQWGSALITMISGNKMLAPIYEGNILLRIVTGAISHMM